MKKMKLISTLLLTGLFLVSCGGDKKTMQPQKLKPKRLKPKT